jgi:hypothetical protein
MIQSYDSQESIVNHVVSRYQESSDRDKYISLDNINLALLEVAKKRGNQKMIDLIDSWQ